MQAPRTRHEGVDPDQISQYADGEELQHSYESWLPNSGPELHTRRRESDLNARGSPESAKFRTTCVRDTATSAQQKTATYLWYNYKHPANNTGATQTCELDHLISLEIGGADTLDNIWPQCGPNGVSLRNRYFKQKDIVENYLAAQIKAGKMKLADVQKGIAEDWTQYLDDAKKACPAGNCK